MKRIVVVVHWLGLLLAFDLVKHSLQIEPDTSQLQNNTTRQEKSLKDTSFFEKVTNITQISDTQLSASERNRRLIPYLAFYLPSSDIPINQAYAIQRPKQHSSNYQLPPTAVDSAGPLPPPTHIPIPTAYMHMKLPTAATAQQTDIAQDYPSAGDVYHKIAYGTAHYPLPATLKNTGKKIPILHLLPPGHPAPAAPTLLTYKHSGAQRQKTVQHFPPLNTQTKAQTISQEHPHQQHQQQQQQHQEQQILYQPPVKQSKINLTPFTSSNTLPGHFIPIIYTPVSNANNNNNNKNQQQNDNINNYNYVDNKPAIEESPQIQQVEKEPHIDTHNQVEQHQQQQQQIVAELELLQSVPKHSPKTSHSHSPPQQQHQLQFITDSGPLALTSPQLQQNGVHQPVAAAHPTANSIYHVINEPTQSLSSVPQHQALIASKPLHQKQQQQQKPQPFRIKQQSPHAATHPHFHPPQPENFFNNEQSEHASHAAQQQQQDYKYLNAENMTPQEKYVLYLQQRMRYNKQQQQQQLKQRERAKEREHEHDQYVKQYPQHTPLGPPAEQIFIIASSASPVDGESIELQKQQAQHQQRPLQHKLQNNYAAMHNPATYPVIGTPHPSSKLTLSAKQQHYSNAKPLYLPVPKFLSELEVVRQQQGHKQIQKLRQHTNNDGPSQPPYIDYIIEEPKQSLDEEQQGNIPTHQPNIAVKPTLAPPQAAYIVITTALPPAAPKPTEYYGSTLRPAYKNQPTIRLQAVAQEDQQKNYPTRRPTIIAPQLPNTAFSNKPNYKQVAIKLQPSYDYETGIESTPTPPQLEKQHATPTPTSAQLPAYYAGDDNNNKQQASQSIPDPNQLPDIRSSSLAEILHKLQASNHLPQTLTADNIDNSIKTLITILNNLKQTQTIVANPPQHHETPTNAADYDYNAGGSQEEHGTPPTINVLTPNKPNKHPGPSTGRPGIDYPNYAEIPQTSFDCTQQRYKGFFGDPETNCQVWHYCDLNGGKASFLCPNGTIFSQIALTCDWWFNVKCSTTAQLYVLNERLYKYILPFTPKFPEDYSGPLVDKYLAMKFQEMEEKTQVHQKDQKEAEEIEESPSTDNNIEETTLNVEPISAHRHEAKNSYVSEQSSERNLLIDDEPIDDDDNNKSPKSTAQESTTATTNTNSTDLGLSFSLKPIVVSSTEGPDYTQNSSEEQETKESNEEQHKPTDMKKNNKSEDTYEPIKFKVSVEKVEVIEIKPDGRTGHITPAELYESR